MRNLLITLCAAGALGLASPGVAMSSPVCAPQDSNGISWCSDGSYQLIDDRGHLLIIGPDGVIRRDLDPSGPFY